MNNNEVSRTASEMQTGLLGAWINELEREKRKMKGNIQGDKKNIARNNEVRRYLVILNTEMDTRQLRLKGF